MENPVILYQKKYSVIYQQQFVYFCIIGVYTLSAEKD